MQTYSLKIDLMRKYSDDNWIVQPWTSDIVFESNKNGMEMCRFLEEILKSVLKCEKGVVSECEKGVASDGVQGKSNGNE